MKGKSGRGDAKSPIKPLMSQSPEEKIVGKNFKISKNDVFSSFLNRRKRAMTLVMLAGTDVN